MSSAARRLNPVEVEFANELLEDLERQVCTECAGSGTTRQCECGDDICQCDEPELGKCDACAGEGTVLVSVSQASGEEP